jgi:hypothetical protein
MSTGKHSASLHLYRAQCLQLTSHRHFKTYFSNHALAFYTNSTHKLEQGYTNNMAKKKIPEIRYRASRICRVLGNSTAYETMNILKKGKKTPQELARILGLSLPTVSHVL